MPIRIIIADDQELVRTGFEMILNSQPDMEVVGTARDGMEALHLINEEKPDVALLDIRMPTIDGLEVCRRVAGSTNVVIVTTFEDDTYVEKALEYGARGFLLKDSGTALLIEAVRAAANNQALISPKITDILLNMAKSAEDRTPTPDPDLDMLSAREMQVAQLIAHGRTNAEIADTLDISLTTVKSHVSRIQNRLELRNRVEIAAKLWAAGVVE
ncbi:response regulator [Corynebacterium lactis]|uniref:LuxR family transcriptional regulator n=1 Tax=Corynebacterium lactis RW2-5 TaxID=1408189 RepID=A0A0K2GXJ6_9CORY|nr:response regulator transcription factor [Corynebacterium lactis]ALA66514.1 LuxR family transcriptional regulator [Corynebacterium lactis RW2-5]